MMNPDNFDSELKTYYLKIKSEILKEHKDYVANHPELREILNDFMSSVLLEKPQDVYDYSTQYFQYFNIDKDKIRYPPIVISGPSGVGKGTLIQQLLKTYPEKFEQNISYTTRPPRQGETQGVQYFFVSRMEFEKEMAKNSFYSLTLHNGEYFGTHKGKLNSIINQGKVCILELDIEGAMKVHSNNPTWKFIFLTPPKASFLEDNINTKGGYTKDQIRQRVNEGQSQIEKAKQYEFFHQIKNELQEKTFDEIIKYVQSQYKNLTL